MNKGNEMDLKSIPSFEIQIIEKYLKGIIPFSFITDSPESANYVVKFLALLDEEKRKIIYDDNTWKIVHDLSCDEKLMENDSMEMSLSKLRINVK